MNNLNNKIPVTIRLAEAPLTTALLDKSSMSSIWSKWFSQIGTWISRAQENKQGDLIHDGSPIGEYRANRVGNIITINGFINAGTYTNIMVIGIPVPPIVDIPVLLSTGNGYINTDNQLFITSTSESKILISASFIANAPKEK